MPVVDQLVAVLAEVESTIRARFSRRLTIIGSRYDVDDLLGDVAIKCIRGIDSCRAETETELRHWVLTTAKNTAETVITANRTAKRSTAREQQAIGVATDDSRDGFQPAIEDAPEMVAEFNEECKIVMNAIAQLSPNQATAIRMWYIDGCDYAAISAKLGLSVNMCRLLVSRGLKKVRAKLT